MEKMLVKSYDVDFYNTKADTGPDSTGEVTALVSVFDVVDKQGDRVQNGAFAKTLEKWRASGKMIPMVFAHQWKNPLNHIGWWDPAKCEEVQATADHGPGLMLKGNVDIKQGNPIADWTHRLMAQNRISQFSHGFLVPQGGEERSKSDGANDIFQIDLIEAGPTLAGVNPDTLLMEIKGMEDADELRNKAEETIRTKNADLAAAIRKIIAALENAVATYESGVTDSGSDTSGVIPDVSTLASANAATDTVGATAGAKSEDLLIASDEDAELDVDVDIETKSDDPEDEPEVEGAPVIEAKSDEVEVTTEEIETPESEDDIETKDDSIRSKVDWDPFIGNKALKLATESDNPAAAFAAMCAGKTAGDPDTRAGWRLVHHNGPDLPPNAHGVAAALGRVDQTQTKRVLINHDDAKQHLLAHQAEIDAAMAKSLGDEDLKELSIDNIEEYLLKASLDLASADVKELREKSLIETTDSILVCKYNTTTVGNRGAKIGELAKSINGIILQNNPEGEDDVRLKSIAERVKDIGHEFHNGSILSDTDIIDHTLTRARMFADDLDDTILEFSVGDDKRIRIGQTLADPILKLFRGHIREIGLARY